MATVTLFETNGVAVMLDDPDGRCMPTVSISPDAILAGRQWRAFKKAVRLGVRMQARAAWITKELG